MKLMMRMVMVMKVVVVVNVVFYFIKTAFPSSAVAIPLSKSTPDDEHNDDDDDTGNDKLELRKKREIEKKHET